MLTLHALLADLFPDNAIFDPSSGALSGIIDFEEVSIGPLVLDVAMTIIGCAYPKGVFNAILAEEFLRYRLIHDWVRK